MSSFSRDRSTRLEADIAEHVRKAITSVETAPKQKHVRCCILFTWDYQTCQPIWSALKLQPVLGDEVVCWKALILTHKIWIAGPHIVLNESMNEKAFLENCTRMCGQQHLFYGNASGYGPIIRAYANFLTAKLEFHNTHSEFTGNFDFEEYVSLKGVDDLNEGYQTISDLQDLLDKLETFHRSLFGQIAHNECRISALVPVIEESYGVYKFVTSMLSAMHAMVDSPEPLVLLVQRYEQQFWALKKFYEECSRIRYLTSLIDIPKLPNEPPFFLPANMEERQPKPKNKSPKSLVERRNRPPPSLEREQPENNSLSRSSADDLQQHVEVYQETFTSRYPSGGGTYLVGTPTPYTNQPQQPVMYHQQPSYPPQQPQGQLLASPYGGHSQSHTEVVLQQEVQKLTQTLQATMWQSNQYQEQLDRLQEEAAEAKRAASSATNQLQTIQTTLEGELRNAREQASSWRAKYEGMVKLYQELRKEHLELLSRFTEQASQLESIQEHLKSSEELAELAAYNSSATEQLQKRLAELEEARLIDARTLNQKDVEMEILEQRLASLQVEFESTKNELQSTFNVEDELSRIAREIAEAAAGFGKAFNSDGISASQLAVHEAIRNATKSVTGAIGDLIHHATLVQAEIVAQGRGSASPEAFYKQNSEWTEGLISAAKAVARSTLILIENADGVLCGSHSLEQLVVASSGVSAAVAQLISASRVKSLPDSDRQLGLEQAARNVTDRNRALVDSASLGATSSMTLDNNDSFKYNVNDPHASRINEMELQVKMRSLERELEQARKNLGDMRKQAYQPSNSTMIPNNSTDFDPIITAKKVPNNTTSNDQSSINT